MPLVYVVILNYNGLRFLRSFLPELKKTLYPHYKIIVADNASSDDSVAYLSAEHPDLVQIYNDKNYGFAGGYNEALKKIADTLPACAYYVLLNSDVSVTKHWLTPLIETLEYNKDLAAVQPKILSYERQRYFEYAGASGGYIDALFYPFCRGRLFFVCEKDEGQYQDFSYVFWVSGTAFCIRSHLFHEMGGFNPYFFAHHEEIDLCWRLQNKGFKLAVQPQSAVYHVGGGTLQYNSSKKVYLNHRNNLMMMVANLPFKVYWWRIFGRLLLEGGGLGFYNLLLGRFTLTGAVWKAHIHFIKWYFGVRKKQDKRYFSATYNKKLLGYYKGSVIVRYYFRRKKKFSQIKASKIIS